MDITLTSIVISITIISISLVLLHFLKPKQGNENKVKVPLGSFGLPIIGETLSYIKAANKASLEVFINERKEKYSSKVFKTSLLGQKMVLLCNAEGNKFVFSNENKLVTSWAPSSIGKFFDTQNSTTTEEAEKLRKFVAPLMKIDSLKSYVAGVEDKVKEFLRVYWDNKEIVEVHCFMKEFTFALACGLLLGIEDNESISKLKKTFLVFSEGLVSLPINLPGTKYTRGINAAKKLRNTFENLIKQWRMKDTTCEGEIRRHTMLLSHLKAEGDQGMVMTDSELAAKVLILLTASYDNVSTAMTFVIMYLAEFPDVHEKVLQEQRDIAKGKKEGEALTWEDIQKMKYSWNVASEVLRLRPPSPGFFREAMSDFTYAGFLIPKGWKVHWNAYATHKSPEYFPNPDKFDPSRFENKNNIIPFSYVPFGGGPHTCPGKEYARIVILVMTHQVVTKLKLAGKVYPDEGIVGLPTLRPAKGLPLRISPIHV